MDDLFLKRVRLNGIGHIGQDRDGNEVNLSELEFFVTGISEDGLFARIAPINGYAGYGWDVDIRCLLLIEEE